MVVCFSLKVNANQNLNEKVYIEVITSDAYPISELNQIQKQGISVRIYNLEDGKRMVSQLEANLPKGEQAAKKAMALRIKKMGDHALKKKFSDAFQAIIIGTQYGLTRHPAVVFNHGKAVVYGVTDLTRALTLYRHWTVSK
jgi:integrating conjugative element protein (TIGR03757 family)